MSTVVVVAITAIVSALAAYCAGLVEGHRIGWWEGKRQAERRAREVDRDEARIRRGLDTWPHEGER